MCLDEGFQAFLEVPDQDILIESCDKVKLS